MRVGHVQSSFPPFLFPNGQQSKLHREVAPSKKTTEVKPQSYARPTITKEAFSATMDNYRAYVHQTNAQIQLLNNEASNHNRKVKPLTKTKQPLVQLFNKKYSCLEAKEYNKEVEKFTKTHGAYIKMKRHQGIKPATELVFAAMLHSYSVQLRKVCDRRAKHGIDYPMSLPRIQVNTEFLQHQKRNGLPSIDYCKKTLRNHRDRLEKYGVLQDYEYHGTNKPVDYQINPSILMVLEGENQKTQKTENQSIKDSQRKFLPHNDVDTRTNLKNQKIKEKVDNSTLSDKEVATQRPFKIVFYKTNPSQDAKKANQGPREICKKSAQYLENALKRDHNTNSGSAEASKKNELPAVISKYELAKQLANGMHDRYQPIPSEKLKQLATFSEYTLAEYREIVLQDAIKYAARLWTNNHANAGCWSNAIKLIYEEYKTLTPTGEAKNKSFMYQWLVEWRHRVRYAYKWFQKHMWKNVVYPSIYFDPTRTLSTDVCFAFTAKAWVQNQKKKQQYKRLREKERQVGVRNKNAKKAENKHLAKLDNAIRKYNKGEYSIDDLLSQVATLPSSIQQKLDERFNKLK